MKILAILSILALTMTCQAERIVPVVFTFAATASVQNDSGTTNGITTTGKPIMVKMTTATLLQSLAQAENYQGHYPVNTFPKGSKLVWLNYTDDFGSSHFVVTDSALNPICDVSDVLTWEADIDNAVEAGKSTTASPSLMNNFTQSYLAALNFNDTAAGGGQNITAYFVVQSKLNDVTSKDGLSYKETISSKLVNGAGHGSYYGRTLTLTGSGSANGSAVIAF